MAANTCSVLECEGESKKKGYCYKHYQRQHRHGDVNTTLRAPTEKVSTAERIAWTKGYKMAMGCADCGYNAHPAALDFDHLPGNEKIRDIKSGAQLGWAALQAEVAKCEVVCANCHRIRTAERRMTDAS
jgi:hypothetical protein